MAACCLLVLAPSDPRTELLQKLKEPSRDRLLKVVFCTQVSPDRDLKLGQSSIGSDRSKHLRLVPPAKVLPWDHPSSDQAVQLVCRTEPAFHSFEQPRPF